MSWAHNEILSRIFWGKNETRCPSFNPRLGNPQNRIIRKPVPKIKCIFRCTDDSNLSHDREIAGIIFFQFFFFIAQSLGCERTDPFLCLEARDFWVLAYFYDLMLGISECWPISMSWCYRCLEMLTHLAISIICFGDFNIVCILNIKILLWFYSGSVNAFHFLILLLFQIYFDIFWFALF